jgi:hypothetical protein
MDSLLECVLSGMRGLLLLRPFRPGAYADATRVSKWVMLIRSGELPGMSNQRTGSPSLVAER